MNASSTASYPVRAKAAPSAPAKAAAIPGVLSVAAPPAIPASVTDLAGLLDLDVRLETVTPEIAARWLEALPYEDQRNIVESTVLDYAEQMKAGLWRLSSDAIVIGIRPSGEHLLNGQHRLAAVVKAGVAVTFSVERRLYATDHDMAAEFGVFDRGKRRTLTDILRPLGVANEIGVGSDSVKRAAAAFSFILNGFSTTKRLGPSRRKMVNAEYTAALLLAWKNEIYAFERNLRGIPWTVSGWFHRSTVESVALITFRWQPEVASRFWYEAAQNDGLVKGSATHTLHQRLSTTPAQAIRDGQYVRLVASCWNAYFEGRPRSIIRINENEPVEIKGTPFKKTPVDIAAIMDAKGGRR